MGFLPLIPVVILAVAVGGPRLASTLSAMSFTGDGVDVRNFPHRTRHIPLSAIDRFDDVSRDGRWSQVRFVRAYLLLGGGSKVIVRAASDPELGVGVAGLNNRLNEMRRDSVA